MAASLNWPEGSEHTVVFLTDPPLAGQTGSSVQTSLDGGTKFAFDGWVDNLGLIQPVGTPIQVITANPAITSLTAQVTISYRINLLYPGTGGCQSSSSSADLRRAWRHPGRGIPARSSVHRLAMLLVVGDNLSTRQQSWSS